MCNDSWIRVGNATSVGLTGLINSTQYFWRTSPPDGSVGSAVNTYLVWFAPGNQRSSTASILRTTTPATPAGSPCRPRTGRCSLSPGWPSRPRTGGVCGSWVNRSAAIRHGGISPPDQSLVRM
jgi:hypothetical protein